MEAKKYKASGGDALADVLDLLSSRPAGPKESSADEQEQVRYGR